VRILHDGRAALGFFSRLPVGAVSGDVRPGAVLCLGPLAAAVLALIAALVALPIGTGPLAAALAWSAMAWLTRGLHLDGLADCADGLGSARPPDEAVAVMQRSDIGPFGVVAVVAVAAIQLSALAAAPSWPVLAAVLIAAAASSRAAAVLLAVPGLTAAAGSRLGAWVAGSVPAPAALLVLLLTAAAVGALAAWAGLSAAGAAAAGLAAALPALWWRRTARHRFGGATGDVYGAAIETGAALVLVLLALLLPLG
jgi:adenosylcobinamide-GDP ribazoletransferase